MGALSGLLSGLVGPAVEHIKMLGVPVYPGPLFGLVIAFGLYRWGKVSWWAAVLALVVTLGAWIAAVRGFHIVTDDAARNIYLGGLVAGAIGAAGTMLGGAITLPSLRRLPDWLLILGVGAAAGLLIGPEPDNNLMLLFIVWQAVVAGCFGYALTRR
jgi:hypothetical protein